MENATISLFVMLTGILNREEERRLCVERRALFEDESEYIADLLHRVREYREEIKRPLLAVKALGKDFVEFDSGERFTRKDLSSAIFFDKTYLDMETCRLLRSHGLFACRMDGGIYVFAVD